MSQKKLPFDCFRLMKLVDYRAIMQLVNSSIKLSITYRSKRASINSLGRASALECLHLLNSGEARLQDRFVVVMWVLEAKESCAQ